MDDSKKKGTGIGTIGGAAAGGVAGGVTTGALVGGLTGPAGAAIGAAVGAGVGALSGNKAGEAAGSSGSSGSGDSMHTVIGAFDDESSAQRAIERLVQGGIPRHDVHLEHEQGGMQSREQVEPTRKKSGGFFASLFGADDYDTPQQQSPYAGHADTYDEAVRRGSAVVVVDAADEDQADRASMLLHEAGAIDVDERSQQWRQDGWQPRTALGGQQDLTARDQGTSRQEGVLDVVQEELQIGKRSMDRGGVRVVQRVSSKPVREVVRLREEHAVVERRPVDRAATGQDLSNFKEGTIEVRETVEEPVVAKTARVVEEVRVGKEVRERDETVEETVRRKDVEVERLAGQAGRTTERERAVAADDPAVVSRRTGKDKPTL